jgi:hypothetical protein
MSTEGNFRPGLLRTQLVPAAEAYLGNQPT